MSLKKKILVIDDEPDIVYTIKEICEFAGYEVETAGDGLKGIKIHENYQPNLIIVDYHMPEYDGLTTVKKIRQSDDTVAILVLTVDERQEILEKFMEAGATDFSIKPVKAVDLIARVNINMKVNEIQQKEKDEVQNAFTEKGIGEGTMDKIVTYLRSKEKEVTIKDISVAVELAYQTVHRYIQHLIDSDQVEVISKYGKRGRPTNLYKLK